MLQILFFNNSFSDTAESMRQKLSNDQKDLNVTTGCSGKLTIESQ